MSRRKRAALHHTPPSPPALASVVPVADLSEASDQQSQGARLPVLAVFLGGFWLLLNQGGGTDLAKAPAHLFLAAWWLIAFIGAWRIHRQGGRLWATLTPGLRSYTVALLATMLLNLSAANLFALDGQLVGVALLGWLRWLGVLLSGVVLAVWLARDPRGLIPVILQVLLIHGGLIAVWGLADYFRSGAAEPLSGVFAWHNPAGGYFALLLPVAAARALADRGRGRALGYAALALLLFAALTATLSRGAWLCALIGLTYLVIVQGALRLLVPWRIGMVLGLIALAIALPFVVGGPLAPIRDRLVSLTAKRDFSVEGRGNFYGTAVRLFTEGPTEEGMALFGTGMDTYRYLSPRQQEDARFFASDPHSVLFGFIAELGVPGVLWYIVAWAWWGWIQWGSGLLKPAASAPQPLREGGAGGTGEADSRIDAVGLSAGLLAGWLHWTIDFDHTFWLITWTAVCFVATLVTMLRTRLGLGSPVALMPGPEEAPRVAVTERVKLKELQLSQLMGNMAVIVLGFGAATSLLYATSRVLYDRGTAAYDRYFPPRVDPRSNEPPQLGDPQNLVAAKNAYTTAALLWPWGGEAWRGLSLAQFALAARATENSEVVLLTQQAKESATQAAENASYDARNWTHLAKVIQMEQALGLIDTEEAAEKIAGALIIAQIADPINNPQVYSLLAQAVAVSPEEEAKRNDIIVLTVDRFSRFFPPDQIAEYSKTRLDRSWTELPVHYLMLWPLYLDALRGQGDTDGLNKAIDTARRHIIPAAREAEYVPQAVIEPLIQNLEAAMAGTTPTPPEPPMDRADV